MRWLLRIVGRRPRVVRSHFQAARTGGDEVTVVLEQRLGPDDGQQVRVVVSRAEALWMAEALIRAARS